jgi:hypothetical protein
VRRPLVRSHGKRRYQAVSDGSTWDQLGTGLEARPLSPYHAGLARLRLSAPFLRIPLFRHALFPSAFRRQVRRLTSGTFPRFPHHLCGDMKLVVTAHADAVGSQVQRLVRRYVSLTMIFVARCSGRDPCSDFRTASARASLEPEPLRAGFQGWGLHPVTLNSLYQSEIWLETRRRYPLSSGSQPYAAWMPTV